MDSKKLDWFTIFNYLDYQLTEELITVATYNTLLDALEGLMPESKEESNG